MQGLKGLGVYGLGKELVGGFGGFRVCRVCSVCRVLGKHRVCSVERSGLSLWFPQIFAQLPDAKGFVGFRVERVCRLRV